MTRAAAGRTMRSQLCGPVLALVAAQGGDAGALVRRFGLPADAASLPEVSLPLATLHAFLDAAEVAAGDCFLGLHLAERLPRGAYGVLEFACRTAPSVRAAIARIVRYVGLLNDLVSVSFEEDGRAGRVEQRIAGEPLAVGRHGNEFFVATVLVGARTLTGAAVVPERVWFAHPPPDGDRGELVRFLGTDDVAFGAGGNGLRLAAATLDLPLATSDPPLHSLLAKQAEDALAATPAAAAAASSLVHVRRRVHDALAGGSGTPPTLEAVAAGLRMSARTLQRRLAGEGTSFQDVLDDVRRELALAEVRGGRRPLGEIAFLLGYAELSPFLRAFRRWTGKTPGELRGR